MPKAKQHGQRKLTVLNPLQAPSLYANHVQLATSGIEVYVVLGEIVTADKQEISVKENVKVIMSARTAAEVHKLLGDTLRNAEQKMKELAEKEAQSTA